MTSRGSAPGVPAEHALRTWAVDIARRAWPFGLAAWFAWQSYQRISFFVVRDFPLGLDARIYYRGVTTWLAGGDPWTASVFAGGATYNYAGTPVTTVVMAPVAVLSEDAFTALWLGATWVAAFWTLRRLHLPVWWILFPPITEALFSANPQLVVLALLLVDGSIASAFATALKVYAFIPLAGERRWRQIAVAAAFSAATILIAPRLWVDYFRQFGSISERLQYQSIEGFSAFYFPALLVVALVALILLARTDSRAAGWLAVPAVWPSSQLHYTTMALPVMTPIMGFFLAVPILRLPPFVITLEICRRLVVARIEQPTERLDRADDAARPAVPSG